MGLIYSRIYFGHGSSKVSRYGSNVLIMVVRVEKCTFTDFVNLHNPIKNIEDESSKIASWLISIECAWEIKVCHFIRELTMLTMVCNVSFHQYRFIIIIIRPHYERWQCCRRCVLLVQVIHENYTLAGWNGFLVILNPEFIKSYFCMVLDYDWSSVILLATRFFFGHFWGELRVSLHPLSPS